MPFRQLILFVNILNYIASSEGSTSSIEDVSLLLNAVIGALLRKTRSREQPFLRSNTPILL